MFRLLLHELVKKKSIIAKHLIPCPMGSKYFSFCKGSEKTASGLTYSLDGLTDMPALTDRCLIGWTDRHYCFDKLIDMPEFMD